MKNRIRAEYTGKMSFDTEVSGYKIHIDVSKEDGGDDNGARPKQLMLTALAGCTGLDIVSLLKKMRVDYDQFAVEVEGELSEEHPKQYIRMKIFYIFKGEGIDEVKIKKAVDLSLKKYCGVSAVYQKVMPVTYEIVIE